MLKPFLNTRILVTYDYFEFNRIYLIFPEQLRKRVQRSIEF